MAPKRVRQMMRQRGQSMNKGVSSAQFSTVSMGTSYSRHGTIGPKSLNISLRRQENERIERENQAFAKRLFDGKGAISMRKMTHEFADHLKHQQNIRKVGKPLPGHEAVKRKLRQMGGGSSMLPPLRNYSNDTIDEDPVTVQDNSSMQRPIAASEQPDKTRSKMNQSATNNQE